MAYILEETKGNLPTWLAPVQARIMPVKTDDPELNEYAQKIYDALDAADVRVELDDRAEKLGYRMREGQVQKVPYERKRRWYRCIPSPWSERDYSSSIRRVCCKTDN